MHEQATTMMMPPPRIISQSAPTPKVGSPNVSPPNSYSPYSGNIPSILGPHGRSSGGTPSDTIQNPLDIHLLATAASQVEREDQRSRQPVLARHHHYHHHHHHPYYVQSASSNIRLPSLSQYAHSQSISRSHSHEEELRIKRSSPNSPLSTAPSSPTCSLDSLSPTPDHTPLATPAHSPHLRPSTTHNIHLPGIRHLSLHPNSTPPLAPMEPQPEGSSPYGSLSPNHTIYTSSNGPRISEIMSRPDAHRKLPVPHIPKVTVQDMLNHGGPEYMSGSSSAAHGIMAVGGIVERY